MNEDSVKVGVLYPDRSAEDEYAYLGRVLKVPFIVATTPVAVDAHREDALRAIGSVDTILDGAGRFAHERISAAIWACTSGSFIFGRDGAEEQASRLSAELGVPATSTSLAFGSAACALGMHRVAIAATYPDDITARFASFLATYDVEVVRSISAGVLAGKTVGTLTKEWVMAFVRNADSDAADAIFVPDTALHTIRVLGQLEQALAKPVLTANQVSAWAVLRLAGASVAGAPFGALGAVNGATSADGSATSRRWSSERNAT